MVGESARKCGVRKEGAKKPVQEGGVSINIWESGGRDCKDIWWR